MTVTVGSKWVHKRSTSISAVVVRTMRYKNVKYIIYACMGRFQPEPVIKIASEREFIKTYRHPDTVGDVP